MNRKKAKQQENTEIGRKFQEFVRQPDYPCLGAKAALNAEACELHYYNRLGENRTSVALAQQLSRFAGGDFFRKSSFATFVALFRQPRNTSELEFEHCLWKTLEQLHRVEAAGSAWDQSVSPNPAHANFAFSFAGHAFYVVGMHANSSRLARRFLFPTLIFNPHAQFRSLRAAGKWEGMKTSIRKRDAALQGCANPMLADFGEKSEARQYSGRVVEANWSPPFAPGLTDKPHGCPFSAS